MVRARGGAGGETRPGTSLVWPQHAAWWVFQPGWIPEVDDPLVERLKRLRIIAGLIVAAGVYTFVAHDFAFTRILENLVVACGVLLLVAPLTVGVMLLVWRRGGPLRPLRPRLLGSLWLLLFFIGAAVGTLLLMYAWGQSHLLPLVPVVLWLMWFVGAAGIRINGNFFGTAAIHRALPPVLASVASWLMAVPDLVTGDLRGLGLRLGVVFVLGAPVLVTAIALLEMRRLRRLHGIRLRDHPGTAHRPARPGAVPPQRHGGRPPAYGQPPGNPYAGGSSHS
ncbi:hypothetical protein [Streptomyces sp. NPDC048638]|uniref:hypothetical protein n=1 Tax=Streptomyces sp. NPDC048638 TaxID=3365580 RepID=UPI003711E4F6